MCSLRKGNRRRSTRTRPICGLRGAAGEIWGSVIYSGFEYNASAVVYAGSDSYGLTVWNASNGVALSWYTTGGNIWGSPALYDGKLYVGSADNNVYCFEDHVNQGMAMSMSVDKTTVDLNNSESVTVTAKLTGVNSLNPYPYYTPAPPLPNAPVTVTFTKPDGTNVDLSATTDINGMVTVTYTPTVKGTWKVMAYHNVEDMPRFSYGFANTEQMNIEATSTTTTPGGGDGGTGTGIPMEYVYAAIAVIVIVIIAAAALMLLRKRKK